MWYCGVSLLWSALPIPLALLSLGVLASYAVLASGAKHAAGTAASSIGAWRCPAVAILAAVPLYQYLQHPLGRSRILTREIRPSHDAGRARPRSICTDKPIENNDATIENNYATNISAIPKGQDQRNR